MTALLGPDGWPYRLLSRWWQLVGLGVLWAVWCLPVVTAPAATEWLLDAVGRTDEPVTVRGALRSVVGRLGRSWRLAAVHLGVALLVAVALLGPSDGGPWSVLVLLVGSAVALTWSLLAPWSVVLHADRPWRAALRDAHARALRHWPLAVLSAAAVLAGPVAVVLVPSWLWLVVVPVLPGAIAVLVTRLCDRAAPTGSAARPPTTETTPDPGHTTAPSTRGPIMIDIVTRTGARP